MHSARRPEVQIPLSRRLAFAVAATAVVVAAVLPALARTVDITDTDAPEPSCTEWLNGPAVKLKALRPNIVLLHLSDPTRSTSKAAHMNLKRYHDEFGGGDLRIVEVLVQSSSFAPASHVEKNGATWRLGVDGKGATEGDYPGSSTPRTYLIGPDGRIEWNGHIGGLSKQMLEAQLARVQFFDAKRVPAKAKSLAKAVTDEKYGAALAEARKLLDDERTPDDVKTMARFVDAEVPRAFEFQWKKHTEELLVLDRAGSWARLERLAKSYKGTSFEAQIDAAIKEADDLPQTAYCVTARKELNSILDKAGSTKLRDIESVIARLKLFVASHQETFDGDAAVDWVRELERRIRDGEVK